MLAWFFGGSGPVLLKILYLCDFSGGGGPDPLSPPLDPPMFDLKYAGNTDQGAIPSKVARRIFIE